MSKKQYRERGTDTPEAPVRMVDIDTAAAAQRVATAERVPIFAIDGVIYDMPKVVRAEVPLGYLEVLQTKGEELAAAYLIRETLGKKALKALRQVEGLDPNQWASIMAAVRRLALPKDRGRKAAV